MMNHNSSTKIIFKIRPYNFKESEGNRDKYNETSDVTEAKV